jgi:5,10-methylenetetrahydromethanopterin reductase
MANDSTFRTSRLATYVLPGASRNPLAGLDQAAAAERLGLGSVWVGERYESKEVGAVCGALAVRTDKIKIVAGVTHFGTRHPELLAGMGTTLQALSKGRFILGVGRSAPNRWAPMGLPVQTLASMEDHASIIRRLWAGQSVSYDGPAGHYPRLVVGAVNRPDVVPPPLILAAIGPKTLELAGRAFDGVVLHPFLTTSAVTRSREIVREAARRGGRDPDSVRIYGQIVIAPDLPPEKADLIIAARALTYLDLPALGDQLMTTNGWDLEVLHALRKHPLMSNVSTFADYDLTLEQRIQIMKDVFPPQWLEETSGSGSADNVAGKLRKYLAAGIDELVMHGMTADKLDSTIDYFVRAAG